MYKSFVSALSKRGGQGIEMVAEEASPEVKGPLEQHEIRERLERLVESEQLDHFTRLWAGHWLKAFSPSCHAGSNL